MKIWDRWTVRRNPRGKDHFYEWVNSNKFVYVCTRKPVVFPVWFRSSVDNNTYPSQFLKAFGIDDDKRQMAEYPELDMCKQCLAIMVMQELSD